MTDMRKIINLLDYKKVPTKTLKENVDVFSSFKSWGKTQTLVESSDEPDFAVFTGPAYWASYLVNGDSSGLEPDELLEADKWRESILPYHVQDIKRDQNGEPEDPYYSINFDLHSGTDFEGGNVVDYVCGKHEHVVDEEVVDEGYFDNYDDDGYFDDEEFPDDPEDIDFADPGGRSALRAASNMNPRNCPCPTCGRENMLTPADVRQGYQCDICADSAESGF
jgi:hypothetical protein